MSEPSLAETHLLVHPEGGSRGPPPERNQEGALSPLDQSRDQMGGAPRCSVHRPTG